jgi:hypothetical protein
MDFVPEKPALEVDGARSSRLGGIGAGGEGGVKEADGEVLLPIVAGEEDEPALMCAVVEEELRSPIAEVAHPLAVIVNFDAVCGLAATAFPQLGVSHLLAFHRIRELGRNAEEVPRPGKCGDDAGGPPLGRDIGRRLERQFLQPGP